MAVGLAPLRSGARWRGAHRCSFARWFLGRRRREMGQSYLTGLKALQILVIYGNWTHESIAHFNSMRHWDLLLTELILSMGLRIVTAGIMKGVLRKLPVKPYQLFQEHVLYELMRCFDLNDFGAVSGRWHQNHISIYFRYFLIRPHARWVTDVTGQVCSIFDLDVGEAVFVEAALSRLPELPTDIQQGLRSRLSGLMAHRATKLEARDLGDLGDGSARVRQGKGQFWWREWQFGQCLFFLALKNN